MNPRAENPSDAELISRSLLEPEVFGQLFDRHANPVGNYFARRVVYDHVEALLSEVFLTAFKTRQRYDIFKPNALPWLFGIAHNHLRHHYRSHHREQRGTERFRATTSLDEVVEASFEERIVEAAFAETDLQRMQAMIDLRPAIEREVLLLYAWEELTYEQIAVALSIPIGTVRSRLNRVRNKIRELDERHWQRTSEGRNGIGAAPSVTAESVTPGDVYE